MVHLRQVSSEEGLHELYLFSLFKPIIDNYHRRWHFSKRLWLQLSRGCCRWPGQWGEATSVSHPLSSLCITTDCRGLPRPLPRRARGQEEKQNFSVGQSFGQQSELMTIKLNVKCQNRVNKTLYIYSRLASEHIIEGSQTAALVKTEKTFYVCIYFIGNKIRYLFVF